MDLPESGTRAEEPIITDEEHNRLMGFVKQRVWRDYCTVLKWTGARPGEIANCTAADFRPEARAIVYPPNPQPGRYRHKTAYRQRTRIIRLRGEALEIIQRRAAEYPVGTLFGVSEPGEKKLRWWNKDTPHKQFSVWAKKLGLSHLRPNSYRHTFATKWLMGGGNIDVLAQLMGNTPLIIRKTYSHLCSQVDYLDGALDKFLTPTSTNGTQTSLASLPEYY
jgi:integrase